MPVPIFLSLETQKVYFAITRAVFCVSILFHLACLVFLIKFTPSTQAAWRKYMLCIQGVFITIDVYVDILMQPLPLVPLPIGFTTGYLCKLGIPVQIQGAIALALVSGLTGLLVLCVLHRHQSIIVGTSRYRLSKVTNRVCHFTLMLIYSSPGVLFSAIPMDPEFTINVLKSNNLLWITERGCDFYLQDGIIFNLVIGSVVLVITSSVCFLALLFLHIRHILNKNIGNRSDQSIRNTRTSVKRLFVQLFTPMFLMSIPATIVIIPFVADGLLSFEFCLSAFSMLYLHPIGHSVLLLSLTPAFRRKIMQFLSRFKGTSVTPAPDSAAIPITPAKTTRSVDHESTVTQTTTQAAASSRQGMWNEKEGEPGDAQGEPVKEQERVSYQNMIVRYCDWSNVRIQVAAYFALTLLTTIYIGHRFIGRRKILYVALGASIPASVILMLNLAYFTRQLGHFILTLSCLMILMITLANLIEMLPYETRYLACYCYYLPMNFSYTTAVLHFRVGFSIYTVGMCSMFANLLGIVIVRFFMKDSICHLNIRNNVNAIEATLHKEEQRLYVQKRNGSRNFHAAVAKKIFEDIVYLDQDELKLSEFLKRLYKSFVMIDIVLSFLQIISAGIHDFENQRFTESRFYEASELAEDRVLGFALASIFLFFLRKAHRSRVICFLFAAMLLTSAARHFVIRYDTRNHCSSIEMVKDSFTMFSILFSVLSYALCLCFKFTILLHFLETSPSIIRPMVLILIYLPVKVATEMMKKYYTTRNLDFQGSSVVTAFLPIYAYHVVIILITMIRTRSRLPFSLYLFDLMPQSDSEREDNHGSNEKIRPMMEATALPVIPTKKEKQEIKDQKPDEKQSNSQGSRGKEEQEKPKWSSKRIFKST